MARDNGEMPLRQFAATTRKAQGTAVQGLLQRRLKRIAAEFSLCDCGVYLPPSGNSSLATFCTPRGLVHFPGAAVPDPSNRTFLPLGESPSPQAWFFFSAETPLPQETLKRRVQLALDPLLAEMSIAGTSGGIALPAELLCGETIIWEDGFLLHETRTMYRFCRGLQKTPRLNDLIHFVLSALTSPEGGDFPAAILLMLNDRSGAVQGLLGVTRNSSQLVLPPEDGADGWFSPRVTAESQRHQRNTAFGRAAAHLRITAEEDHPLNRALHERCVLPVDASEGDCLAASFAAEGGSGDYLCIPLLGRERPFGVLVVGGGAAEITVKRRDFLDLFARQAETAIENALLLRRLEGANAELHEAQERVHQDEKLAMLGELVASIAHDIKTPLVTVGGFARRLERLTESREARNCAATIAREVQRLEEILSGILSFSRRQMICYAPCKPIDLIRQALAVEEDALRQAGIKVVTENEGGLPQIQCDQVRITQVLVNLVVNARHAMAAGGVLTVRAKRGILRGNPAVAIEVEDSGVGIPDEILGQIFKPFFTTKVVGTGLGLAICARIVEQHHGEIRALNHSGGGALFRFLLPASAGAG